MWISSKISTYRSSLLILTRGPRLILMKTVGFKYSYDKDLFIFRDRILLAGTAGSASSRRGICILTG